MAKRRFYAWSAVVGVSLACGVPSSASGQTTAQPPGTLSTSATPVTTGGKLVSCEVEFQSVIADWVYREGGWVNLRGSLVLNGYLDGKPRPSIFVKLVVEDIAGSAGNLKVTPDTPFSVNVLGLNGKPLTFETRINGDAPGSLLTSFKFDDVSGALLTQMYERGNFTILFNRRDGGRDVRTIIDLNVADVPGDKIIKNDSTRKNFMICVGDLLKDMQSELKGKGK